MALKAHGFKGSGPQSFGVRNQGLHRNPSVKERNCACRSPEFAQPDFGQELCTPPTNSSRRRIAMKAKDVMSRPVISVEPRTSVQEAAQLMLQRRISGLPVVEKLGRLVGIVTEADFLRRAETGTQRRRARWLEFLVGPGRLADEYVHTHG